MPRALPCFPYLFCILTTALFDLRLTVFNLRYFLCAKRYAFFSFSLRPRDLRLTVFRSFLYFQRVLLFLAPCPLASTLKAISPAEGKVFQLGQSGRHPAHHAPPDRL